MTSVLIVSDNGTPTGYGRIADELGKRLHKRGHTVMALSHYYDGLLPPVLDGERLPYHVGVLSGKPNWVQSVGDVINATHPDIVLGIQDFPYHTQLFQAPLDWSQYGRVLITPVDGVPILPSWVKHLDHMDGALTISQFGVDAFKAAGRAVGLCRPAVNLDEFYPMPDAERQAERAKLGIKPEAFVLGTVCANQGRKAVTLMLRAFFQFAQDKPDARFLMSMPEISPAGWPLPEIIEQQGWDRSKIIFKSDAAMAGVLGLRERYNVMDAHTVLAHREGYGLPHAEAMACGVVSIAMDYCSGPEIVGEGKGVLVKTTGYTVPGTWGGAEDHFPDLDHMVERLQWLYDNPAERAAMAERGKVWARAHTWDHATDEVVKVLEAVQAKRQTWQTAQVQPQTLPEPVVSPDGTKAVEAEAVPA
jgi:glycosyltransferase involved in cell wall biosynthesis